jgi:hypothetical protein
MAVTQNAPAGDRGVRKDDSAGKRIKLSISSIAESEQVCTDRRSPRRQRLASHLHRCGARPVLEALLAMERSQPLDAVLDDFGRILAHVYRTVGASDLGTDDQLVVVDGGRR